MHTSLSRMRPLIVLGMIALAACQPTDKNQAPTGVVAKAMDEAAKGLGEASQEMDKAREEIATLVQDNPDEVARLLRGWMTERS